MLLTANMKKFPIECFNLFESQFGGGAGYLRIKFSFMTMRL